jgi:hypothetical protein
LLLRGTAESGALKANALPGGAGRLTVRAVKGAQFALIGAHAPDPSELNEVLALIEKKLANRAHDSERGYLTESTE